MFAPALAVTASRAWADAAGAQGSGLSGAALGPWLFASVALVLVAGLAWYAGRQAGERKSRRGDPGKHSSSTQRGSPARAAGGTSQASVTDAPAAQEASYKADEAAAFTYALSHDLRAPLRVVEGFARILKEDYGRQLDRIGNDHLDRMLGASARMNSMIEAMLSLAQLSSQPLARQPVNLSQLAHFIIDDLRRAHPERKVEVDIAPGLQIHGDPTLLRQMLDNLLGNAWKYTGRSAAARISLQAHESGAGAATASMGLRIFEVADNGAGFDMRSADRLFGLFQRLHGHSDFPGTGLGLASVQRIVRRHGGQIWAESEPGNGARFYFSLPG